MSFLRNLTLVPALGLLSLGAPALRADGVDLGMKLTGSIPEGDLAANTYLNNKVGYGGGLHLAISVPGGKLVPRVDYTSYQNNDNGQAKAQMLQAGVDYDFYFSPGRTTGPYLGVGAGWGSTKFQQTTPQFNDTPNNIFYGGQLGCMFTRHIGTELRYTYAEYKTHFSGPVPDWTAPTLNLSLILQF